MCQHENQRLLTAPASLGHMANNFNRAKGRLDAKVLRENEDVREAHAAWTAVIYAHQSTDYGRGYSQTTRKSISTKKADFFPVWSASQATSGHASCVLRQSCAAALHSAPPILHL